MTDVFFEALVVATIVSALMAVLVAFDLLWQGAVATWRWLKGRRDVEAVEVSDGARRACLDSVVLAGAPVSEMPSVRRRNTGMDAATEDRRARLSAMQGGRR